MRFTPTFDRDEPFVQSGGKNQDVRQFLKRVLDCRAARIDAGPVGPAGRHAIWPLDLSMNLPVFNKVDVGPPLALDR